MPTNMQDVIIYAIATIILVGSWVVNILRKQAEDRREQEQTGTGGAGGAGGAGASTGSKASLDDMAARRREELRALARERGEARTGPANRPGAGEPVNMSMAERIARARAKAQYEQRAQRIGAPASSSPGQSPPPARPEPMSSPHSAGGMTEMERARQRDLQRRQAEARKRQEAQRRANAEQERRSRQRQQERQQAQQAAEQRRREAEKASLERSRQRSVRSACAPDGAGAGAGAIAFNRQSLRDAVILREVFDRPLALREASSNS